MKTNTLQQPLYGLGWWNIYFIIKIGLFTQDIIRFHPLENFAFVAFLLLPLKPRALKIIRQCIAVPIGLWLMHFDSFLPPLNRLWGQIGQLLQFNLSYLIELAGRFISPQAFLALFVLIFAYYFLNQVFRISVFVILALVYISLPQSIFNSQAKETVIAQQPTITQTTTPSQQSIDESGPVNDAVLNQAKELFFKNEAQRRVTFPSVAPSTKFDLLFLSICSVAWDDIEIAGLENHPLFKEFDVMFDNFSAATSYSGPAVIRLLRASCGQETHQELFSAPSSKQCFLFDNLAKLGFQENLLLNHDGKFDDFLGLLKEDGDLQAPLMSQAGLEQYQSAFDGSPIYRDKEVLTRWLGNRENAQDSSVVALYNTISLHDGNRIIRASGKVGLVSYKLRLKNLLDDLYDFFQTLKASKRNVVVMLVPEHGAGMRGDKMQIAGMREIPSSTIVHTPVGMKIFGENITRTGDTVHINAESSYLAVSALVSRILAQDIYSQKTFDPKALTQGLPKTKMVAQNSGTTVMEYNNKPYVSLDGSTWSEYPKK
ncbi:cellulose biosynthesis protein BcsG [Aliivibrio finisterrensis]|uniref:Cellulose biosynthesis protein BcsG n=1 Tax=Aliivibrio finisterrensis TaxID=511998 RepID=A0A4Q5KY23_9GAMM|nr:MULTISPECIES: cellulose biosynthesis protein BcsG [Aliivibrio]MDD9177282.1 cellulose biosynthesis protein BcsG [Aliivibrio sp. A6]RYU54769.1 cellulose biosynthesis protein BcsG [Aliivibrio finisterrensis]RYU56443.1 cellulose biosynthesis protein BcsG [Aliivibrio finisterrensis]RYU61564.1 cellulose biosynthesis protein BcsG [Aliivibrio finisterrensis]RYU66847.1 cellulose biosynthesis protein BcsG [Aliivibrio finisterrensis]